MVAVVDADCWVGGRLGAVFDAGPGVAGVIEYVNVAYVAVAAVDEIEPEPFGGHEIHEQPVSVLGDERAVRVGDVNRTGGVVRSTVGVTVRQDNTICFDVTTLSVFR